MKFCATFVNFLSTTFWFFIFARILMCRTSSIYIYFLPDLNLSGILKTRKSLEKGIDERFKTNLEVIVNSFWLISTNFLISKFYNYKLVKISSVKLSFTWPHSFSSLPFSVRLNKPLTSLAGRITVFYTPKGLVFCTCIFLYFVRVFFHIKQRQTCHCLRLLLVL